MLTNFFGKQCPDCGEKNARQADLCTACGAALATARPRPPTLNGNRWEAAADELAVFFMSSDLKGLFSKPLCVPSGTRAWMFQDNKIEEFPAGDYAVETLFDRFNTFFGGKQAEILITRNAALPVQFHFDDILSADMLPVTVDATISLGVGDSAAFRNHFMRRTGAVTAGQLSELLAETVRQIIADTIGARHLEEMHAQADLRQQTERQLIRGLQARFQEIGLAFAQIDQLSLRHERFDAERRLKATMWLDQEAARQHAEHGKTMAELYSRDEIEKLRAREDDMRRRYRNAELSKDEAEFAHLIRLRELAQYEAVKTAETRQQAIDLQAHEKIAQIERQCAEQRRQRERDGAQALWRQDDAETAWRRTQEIAVIRHAAQLRIAEAEKAHTDTLARQQVANTLEKMRVEGEIAQTRMLSDEAERQRRLAFQADWLAKNAQREEQLRNAKTQVAIDEIALAGERRRQEQARIDACFDKDHALDIAKVDARIAAVKRDERMEGLARLININEEYELSKIETDQVRMRGEQALRDQTEESALERRLKEQREARAAAQEQRAHEIERMGFLDTLTAETLIAVADDPAKIAALLELAKTKALGGMAAEKIQAIVADAHRPSDAAATTAMLRELLDKQSAAHAQTQARDERLRKEAMDALVQSAGMIRDAGIGVAQAGHGPAGGFGAGSGLPGLKVCQGCHSVIAFRLAACPQCGKVLV